MNPSGASSHKPMTPKPVSQERDETSELRDELKKNYRRIADLETRVHDLTLQTSLVRVVEYTHCEILQCIVHVLSIMHLVQPNLVCCNVLYCAYIHVRTYRTIVCSTYH